MLDLPMYLKLPSNIPKILDIRRQRFRVLPIEAASSFFHQGSTIIYPKHVVINLRIHCKGNIDGPSAYYSISQAQSWHQIYFLCEFWPINVDDSKLQYIQ
jgi:hypothetical protein